MHRIVACIMMGMLLACAAGALSQRTQRDSQELEDELDRLDRAFGWVNRLSKTRPATLPATRPGDLVPLDERLVAKTQPATRPSDPAAQANPQTRPIVFAIGARPPIQPLPTPRQDISDEQIGQSIQKAVDNLISKFDGGGKLRVTIDAGPAFHSPSYEAGLNALAGYALLQAGLALPNERRLDIKGDFMRKVLDNMKRMNADGSYATYARGIRATALSVHARGEDRAQIREDCNYLVRNHRGGSYTYGDPNWRNARINNRIREGDNSNAQYGLLGVWSSVEAGVGEATGTYWTAVQGHWAEAQDPTGQWGYMPNFGRGRMGPGGASYAMTVAGIASLFVTHDYLDAPKVATQVGRPPFSGALARGLQWLEAGDNALGKAGLDEGIGGWGGGYELYGLERVGLASGFKYFGRHDWYRTLATQVISRQKRDGSFGDVIETSYCVLFLARGRHPILMNKLRFDGAWANRPRDLSNLTRFATRELERPLNWQIVPMDRPWPEWADAPVLYLSSHLPPKLTDRDVAQLRSYIEAGGLLFTHADADSKPFNAFVADLAERLHPDYELKDLPEDHEIYEIAFKVPKPRPKLRYMTNGSRILWIHSDNDLSSAWQARSEKVKRPAFDLGVNLFLWATGKQTPRNRLATAFIPEPRREPLSAMRVARVRYAGNWDPEPWGWKRFARQFQYDTGSAIAVEAVALHALEAKTHPLAHLTGTAEHTWSDAEIASVKKYVEDGGTLLIDACGGSAAFDASIAQSLLTRAFPSTKAQVVDPQHPLMRANEQGMADLSKGIIRPYAVSKVGKDAGNLLLASAGRGRIIISHLDLSTALAGAETWGVIGWTPDSARAIVRNVILWTWDGSPSGLSNPSPTGG